GRGAGKAVLARQGPRPPRRRHRGSLSRAMPAFNFVWRSAYHDSVTLMRLTRDLESVPGVARAAAMMGTPQNRALMQDAGLLTTAAEAVGPIDLVIPVGAVHHPPP